MRDYGRVHCSFWTSPTVAPLSDDGKLLALYLLTSAHSTIAGVFRMPDGYVAEDLGWRFERVGQAFGELLAKGFAQRCAASKWVWVVKHLQWNPPENPNQRKAAAKVVAAVPDNCAWKPDFLKVCAPLLGLAAALLVNPCDTLAQALPNQEQKQEQKQQQEQKQEQHQEQPHNPPAPGARSRPPQPPAPAPLAQPAGARKRTPGFDATQAPLPDWLDRAAWHRWCKDRLARKKPITEEAARLQLGKLAQYRESGVAPEAVLAHAVESGHQGFYLPMGKGEGAGGVGQGGGMANRQEALEQRNRGIAQAWASDAGAAAAQALAGAAAGGASPQGGAHDAARPR